MECNGVEWNGVEWSGVKWSEVVRNGTERNEIYNFISITIQFVEYIL